MAEQYAFGVDRVVFYASICSDLEVPDTVRGFAVRGPPLLETYATELALCAEIPDATRAGERSEEAASVEVLIVASRFDPLTPVALLDAAPPLPDGTFVCTTDVLGHTSLGDPRIGDLVREFLESGDAGAVSTRC